MKLRDYQEAAVGSIFRYFEDGNTGNPLVAMPTGTGKSVVIGEFIKRAFLGYPGQRIIKLTHVKELIQQNHEKLLALWPSAPAGIYSAGLHRKEACYPITFAGIASAAKQPELFGKVDLVLIDEAHLVSPKEGTMYQRFLGALKETNPFLKVIGFTATQYRLGQGMLTDADGLFTDTCFDLTTMDSFNWLLTEGYLSPPVPKQTKFQLDTSKVQIHGGEFVQNQLQDAVDRNEVTYEALKETIELGADRSHWLVFASGVDHALHVRDMLESLGVSATCVHSRMGGKERDDAIRDFKLGKFRAMVNNGILTTGFDFPGIDLICMLRPTQSSGLWVQMLGRGTRPVYAPGHDLETTEGRRAAILAGPKMNCLVLDFAGNTRRLGPINDPVLPKRKGQGGGGSAPVKLCEHCGVYNHASVRFCTNCGAEFPVQVKITAQASLEQLVRENTPDIQLYRVDRIEYRTHKKEGRPDSIVVSYFCGLHMFREWVCLEHAGFASKRSRDWWRERAPLTVEPPATTAEALTRMNELKVPTQIRVWVNKKQPEIMGYSYGSGASEGAVQAVGT